MVFRGHFKERCHANLVSDAPTAANFKDVSAGSAHCVALKLDGSVVSWGDDSEGQIQQTPTGTGFISVHAGAGHSVAVKTDGSLVSWASTMQGRSARLRRALSLWCLLATVTP